MKDAGGQGDLRRQGDQPAQPRALVLPRSRPDTTPRLINWCAKSAISNGSWSASELEALILEMNLIKKHRPHYNVRLKDDKRYPYIKVHWADPYPR